MIKIILISIPLVLIQVCFTVLYFSAHFVANNIAYTHIYRNTRVIVEISNSSLAHLVSSKNIVADKGFNHTIISTSINSYAIPFTTIL